MNIWLQTIAAVILLRTLTAFFLFYFIYLFIFNFNALYLDLVVGKTYKMEHQISSLIRYYNCGTYMKEQIWYEKD